MTSRTSDGLDNNRPAWLRDAHASLDAAVAECYALPAELPTPELLALLLKLNLERAAA